MTKKTIAVVGAGPGIGLAVARKWGAEGYAVALVARNAEKLRGLVERLASEGIEAAAFPADVDDRGAFAAALESIKERFGGVDALYYGPPAESASLVPPRQFTIDSVQSMFDRTVLGAVVAVNSVLPGMLEKGDGALLFACPMSAIDPVLFSANYAQATAALRNYAQALYIDLASAGVYAGMMVIAGLIEEGDTERNKNLASDARRPGDRGWDEYRAFHEDLGMHIPAGVVADALWDMATTRGRDEEILGDRDICKKMREGALAGEPGHN